MDGKLFHVLQFIFPKLFRQDLAPFPKGEVVIGSQSLHSPLFFINYGSKIIYYPSKSIDFE